jgi:hypothetical protein
VKDPGEEYRNQTVTIETIRTLFGYLTTQEIREAIAKNAADTALLPAEWLTRFSWYCSPTDFFDLMGDLALALEQERIT